MQAAQERSARYGAGLLRDVLAGAVLFTATTAFCLWQNTRVAALFDLSYLLDTSWRIAIDQLPYRDFPFAHAPGTFLLHAAIIRIFGRIYWPHILYAAIESGSGTLLTWRILLRVLRPLGGRARWVATLLAATLVPLGIYSIYPHAIYDGDAIFAVLLALWLFARAAEGWSSDYAGRARQQIALIRVLRSVAAGAACVLPLMFKQNIGLAFLGAMIVSEIAVAFVRSIRGEAVKPHLWLLGGMVGAVAVAALAIHATVGLANYRYWTLTFAAQRRLPGIATILGVYHQRSLLWTVPTALIGFAILRTRRFNSRPWRSRILAFLLLAAPFLWMCIALIVTGDPDDRADQLLSQWPHLLVLAAILTAAQAVRFARGRIAAANALLPILLLATIHGTFLSQQLWGSTYAIWPLLALVIALLLMEVREIATPLAAVISATLLLCGGLYAASLERLDYLHLDGPRVHAALPALRMATPGPWLPEFAGMVQFTDAAIPREDGIVLIPGEEPFYFATGRAPQFPVLLTDLATDPYTPEQTAAEMRARNIRWLIVKRDLQLTAPPEYETPALLSTVEQDFALYRSLPGYDVYRRK